MNLSSFEEEDYHRSTDGKKLTQQNLSKRETMIAESTTSKYDSI